MKFKIHIHADQIKRIKCWFILYISLTLLVRHGVGRLFRGIPLGTHHRESDEYSQYHQTTYDACDEHRYCNGAIEIKCTTQRFRLGAGLGCGHVWENKTTDGCVGFVVDICEHISDCDIAMSEKRGDG